MRGVPRPRTYGPAGPVRFAISLTVDETRALEDMAHDAGMPRAALAASLIRDVLKDDAAAHGRAIYPPAVHRGGR